MEHAREEFDGRGFGGVTLIECKQKSECTILKRRIHCTVSMTLSSVVKEHGRTWSKYNGIPEHDVVWAWAAGDPTRRVGREPLKVTDEAATAVGRLCIADVSPDASKEC